MVQDRNSAIFDCLGLKPTTKAASGRYLRSEEIRPGVRYWCSTLKRKKCDLVGVQFTRRAKSDAERLGPKIRAAGFVERDQQSDNKWTFQLSVPYTDGDGIDQNRLREAYNRCVALVT